MVHRVGHLPGNGDAEHVFHGRLRRVGGPNRTSVVIWHNVPGSEDRTGTGAVDVDLSSDRLPSRVRS